jgi:hypothetical protein
VPAALAPQFRGGTAEILVDERDQPVTGVRIACRPDVEQFGDRSARSSPAAA